MKSPAVIYAYKSLKRSDIKKTGAGKSRDRNDEPSKAEHRDNRQKKRLSGKTSNQPSHSSGSPLFGRLESIARFMIKLVIPIQRFTNLG